MDIHAKQQRRFPAVAIVVLLFALCIFPGQYLLSRQFPQIAGLAEFKPELIFLEIPVQLPVVIDLVLAPALFLLMYPLVMLFYPTRTGLWFRLRAAVTGLFALLCCLLIGGLIYYLVQGHLSTEVRNGINSMGIIADIDLAFRGDETIALRGSMVLFICFIIGLAICIRKLRKQPPIPLTREQRMTPYERMLQEKRMKEKQRLPGQRIEQKEEYHFDRNRSFIAVEPEPVQQGRNDHSCFCYSQPIRILKPEAMYFMPK